MNSSHLPLKFQLFVEFAGDLQSQAAPCEPSFLPIMGS
jgi:hypothetical protein